MAVIVMQKGRAGVIEANIATLIRDEAKSLAAEIQDERQAKAVAIEAARRAVERITREYAG